MKLIIIVSTPDITALDLRRAIEKIGNISVIAIAPLNEAERESTPKPQLEYCIISCSSGDEDDLVQFMHDMQVALAKGWEPQGGLAINSTSSNIFQAMTRRIK